MRACSQRTRSSHRRVPFRSRGSSDSDAISFSQIAIVYQLCWLHSPDRFLPFIPIDIIYILQKGNMYREENKRTNKRKNKEKKKKQKKEKRKKERRERCRQVRATVDHYSENAHAYIHTTRTKRDDCFLNRESVYTIPRRARR